MMLAVKVFMKCVCESVFVGVRPALIQLTGNLTSVLFSLHAGVDHAFLLGECNGFMQDLSVMFLKKSFHYFTWNCLNVHLLWAPRFFILRVYNQKI